MGTVLYRPGNTHVVRGIECELQVLHHSLAKNEVASGKWYWSPEEMSDEIDLVGDDSNNKKETDTPDPEIEDEEKEDIPSIGHLNLDALSDDDIRVLGKNLKINNWHTKNIDNLKKEIADVA